MENKTLIQNIYWKFYSLNIITIYSNVDCTVSFLYESTFVTILIEIIAQLVQSNLFFDYSWFHILELFLAERLFCMVLKHAM